VGHATDQAMVAGNLLRRNGFNPRPSPCGICGGKKWHRDKFAVSVILSTILTPSFTSHQRYAICAIDSDAGSYVTSDDSYLEHPRFTSLPGDRGSFAHSLNANSLTAPSNSYHPLVAARTTVLITLFNMFPTRVVEITLFPKTG
jgi:hypothetical protein